MDHERPTLVLDVMQAALSLAVKRFRESPVAPAGETIAIATLALNAPEWFRLVRLVIASPVRLRIRRANIRQKLHSRHCPDFRHPLSWSRTVSKSCCQA